MISSRYSIVKPTSLTQIIRHLKAGKTVIAYNKEFLTLVDGNLYVNTGSEEYSKPLKRLNIGSWFLLDVELSALLRKRTELYELDFIRNYRYVFSNESEENELEHLYDK